MLTDRGRWILAFGGAVYLAAWAFGTTALYPIGLGLVLAWARLRTGSLWTSIGIHAAYVAVFRVGRLVFDILKTPAWLIGPGWPPLIGGAAGWLAVAVTALLLAVVLRRRDGLPGARTASMFAA